MTMNEKKHEVSMIVVAVSCEEIQVNVDTHTHTHTHTTHSYLTVDWTSWGVSLS